MPETQRRREGEVEVTSFLRRFLRRVASPLPTLLTALLILGGMGVAAANPLPVENFFRDGFLTKPALSPDGTQLAGFVHLEGINILLVWDLETNKRKPIAQLDSKKQYLHWVIWANNDRLLVSSSWPNDFPFRDGSFGRTSWLFGIDKDGDDQRVFGKRWLDGGRVGKGSRTGFKLPKVRSGDDLVSLLRDDPDAILIQLHEYDKPGAAVYRMDVESGRLRLVQGVQKGVIRWYADHDGKVRMGFGSESRGGGRWILARPDEDSEWQKIASWDVLANERSFVPLGFAFDRNIVYLGTLSPKGTLGVYEYDLAGKKLGRLVFAHDRYDVSSLVFDRKRRVLEGIRWVGDTNQIHFLDESAAREEAAINKALGGETTWLIDESRDEAVKLYWVESTKSSPRVLRYDRKAQSIEEIYAMYPNVRDSLLGEVRKVQYKARDGYPIDGYLTLPKGKTARNLPTVIYPHGGPWSRDVMGYDRMAQFLANNGFAVLQMNFRGSSGLGEDHRKSGYRQLGQTIQNDITDGTRWLIAEGIADPDRIAIYGVSHGGYASLMGLAQHPELYRCGAALAPVTDLYEMVYRQRFSLYSAANKISWGDLSVPGEEERLKANSPLRLVDKIKDPVLLAHGRHDKIVPYRHTTWMKDALDEAGVKNETIFYEDWHGFIHEPNRVDFSRRLRDFLLRCTAG